MLRPDVVGQVCAASQSDDKLSWGIDTIFNTAQTTRRPSLGMNNSLVTENYRPQVQLRGLERMLTMVDGVSTKMVHSMLVRGDTTILLRFLTTAVMNTFNSHPRMRVLQLKDGPFVAEVHPLLTRHEVTALNLVRLRAISSTASDADDMATGWQQYAEDECSIGFNRFNQLPFFLTVWVDERASLARLMLFSDHYMSDGFSGMVVLHGILDQITLLAKQQLTAPQEEPGPEQPPHQVEEFPL